MTALLEAPEELSRTRRARRTHLLATAAPLFLRDGYGATTMEGIAAAAGVSKATLYKYFADKERLFLELVRERHLAPDERLLADLRKTVRHMVTQINDPAGPEALAQTLLRLLRTSTRHRNDVFFRLLVEIAFANPALVHKVRRELLEGEATDAMASGPRAASGPDVPAILHIVFLAMHGHMLVNDVAFGGENVDQERLAAALAGMISATLARD